MNPKSLLVSALVVLIAIPSALAQQRFEPPEVWRQYAERLPPGAYVDVTLKSGANVKGHVIQASSDLLRVRPKTRIPVPIRDVGYDEIESIARLKERLSPGTKVLIGVGVGAGAVFSLIVALLTSLD